MELYVIAFSCRWGWFNTVAWWVTIYWYNPCYIGLEILLNDKTNVFSIFSWSIVVTLNSPGVYRHCEINLYINLGNIFKYYLSDLHFSRVICPFWIGINDYGYRSNDIMVYNNGKVLFLLCKKIDFYYLFAMKCKFKTVNVNNSTNINKTNHWT